MNNYLTTGSLLREVQREMMEMDFLTRLQCLAYIFGVWLKRGETPRAIRRRIKKLFSRSK